MLTDTDRLCWCGNECPCALHNSSTSTAISSAVGAGGILAADQQYYSPSTDYMIPRGSSIF